MELKGKELVATTSRGGSAIPHARLRTGGLKVPDGFEVR